MTLNPNEAAYLSSYLHRLENGNRSLRRAVDSNLAAIEEVKRELYKIEAQLDTAKISVDSILLSTVFFFGFLIVILQSVKHSDPELATVADLFSIAGGTAILILLARCVIAQIKNVQTGAVDE